MTATSFVRITLLAGALALGTPVYAADASMHDVYLAAEAGKFTEAQAMMDQVLKDHPNSGKAHFVEAELLAKQGKFAAAEAELKAAEKLAPGLPFAKAGAVEKLRTLLASGQVAPVPRTSAAPSHATPAAAPVNYGNAGTSGGGGTPWGLLIVLGLIVAGFIVFASRFMSRRAAPTQPAFDTNSNAWGNAGNPAYPQQGYPQQGYGPGYGPQGGMPGQGPGLGSRIAGGLATGAAVGAGIVAGEALMHHFTDGNRNQSHDSGSGNAPRNDIVYDDPSRTDRLAADDMGGNDFGVNDSSSWDDSSGGGGGDSGGSDDW
jgi:hypothetical protein